MLGHRGGACARAGKHGLGTRGGDGLRGSGPRKGRGGAAVQDGPQVEAETSGPGQAD